jgi:uncharacterized protein
MRTRVCWRSSATGFDERVPTGKCADAILGSGGMAEWAIAAVLKTARGQPLGSSNLPPSATDLAAPDCPTLPNTASVTAAAERLQLLDWKRRILELYQMIRASSEPTVAWSSWRARRDALFRSHSQSPLPAPMRAAHGRLPYYPYDPAARTVADVVDIAPVPREIAASDGIIYPFVQFAIARFTVYRRSCALPLYWLSGYGGGLFLPFRDQTGGTETYAGGRYLLDTIKGADLGLEDNRLILDFNFAYNPSCAYDPAWSCPLAPQENLLPIAVRSGERAPGSLIEG